MDWFLYNNGLRHERVKWIMKHNLIFICFWRTQKLLLLKKNAKYIFIAAEIRKQNMNFPKYHKAYAANFKFVSNIFFKFQDIAGKTQRKRLKVNFHEKNCKKWQKNTKDIQTYKKKNCSCKKLELLFNIKKAFFLSFRFAIIIIIITVTVFIIHFC